MKPNGFVFVPAYVRKKSMRKNLRIRDLVIMLCLLVAIAFIILAVGKAVQQAWVWTNERIWLIPVIIAIVILLWWIRKIRSCGWRLRTTDHKWHNIRFERMNSWARRNNVVLAKGEILQGKMWLYRYNTKKDKYQIRLRNNYAIGIYTSEI